MASQKYWKNKVNKLTHEELDKLQNTVDTIIDEGLEKFCTEKGFNIHEITEAQLMRTVYTDLFSNYL